MFLAVQMPEMDGFEMLAAIGADAVPVVVFVTAYERYALDAFDAEAVDYLLKPFANARFARALERARNRLRNDPMEVTRESIVGVWTDFLGVESVRISAGQLTSSNGWTFPTCNP